MNSSFLPDAVADFLAGRAPVSEDLIQLMQRVVTVVAIVGTLVAAILSLSSPSAGGSSQDTPAPRTCDYELPDRSIQRELERTQTDLMEALNAWRAEDQQAPLLPWIDRQTAAREKAECNAVTHSEEPAEENIQMVQHHLPVDQASGYDFVEAFRSSPAHVNALRDRRMTTAAVGVAYSDSQVWVVIQLEE